MMVWVLTREINAYEQEGAYFEKVWLDKPTHQQLTELGIPTNRLRHVLNGGGGRVKWENEWYWLREYNLKEIE